MKTSKLFFWLMVVGLFISLVTCRDPKPTDLFEGRVTNYKNEGLADAVVEINGTKATTKKDGAFQLKLEKTETKEFHTTARKDGYASYSQLLKSPSKSLKFTLYEATVVESDPTKDINVTDTKSMDRPGPASKRADWTKNSLAGVPLVMKAGKIVDFGFPPSLQGLANSLTTRTPGKGMSISIPANSLVNASSQAAPSGKVNVAVSTIDIFSPGAMPGDYALKRDGKEVGYLVSYGAGFIDIYDKESHYQLKKGSSATITIEIDPSQLGKGKELPQTMPLFLFDEAQSAWVDHGTATLNAERTAYSGKVTHFTAFNLDLDKVNPACIAFQNVDAAQPVFPYQCDIIVNASGSAIQRNVPIVDAGECMDQHAVIRLPALADVGLLFFDNANNPLAVFVAQSGDSYDPAVPPTCIADSYSSGTTFCGNATWNVTTGGILAAIGPTNTSTTPASVKLKWISSMPAVTKYQTVATDLTCVTSATPSPLPLVGTVSTIMGIATSYQVYEAEFNRPTSAGAISYKIQGLDASNAVVLESKCFSY